MYKRIIIGIYKITNLINSKIYIGSSVHISNRKSGHFSHLRKNIHPNKHLQAAFNKYGEDNFVFEILETLDDSEFLRLKEDQYIKKFDATNSKIGYNCKDNVINTYIKFTKEHRENLSKSHKGKKQSQEAKDRIRKARKNQVDCGHIAILQFDLEDNFLQEYSSIKEACLKYNLASTNICKCMSGIYKTCGGFKWKYKNIEERRKRPINKLLLK